MYITIYHTYWLLYCTEHIKMMSNDSTINVGTKDNRVNKMKKIAFNTLRIYIKIYHTYWLLYCTEHIQMMSNVSTINVGTKKQ